MLLSGNYSPIIPTFNSMSPSGKKPPIGTHIESSTKAYTAIGIIKDRPSETDIEAKKKAYKYEVVSLIASMEGLSFKTGASTTNQEKINELFNEDIPALELRLRDLISKQLTTDNERLKAENEYLKMHLSSLLLPTISKSASIASSSTEASPNINITGSQKASAALAALAASAATHIKNDHTSSKVAENKTGVTKAKAKSKANKKKKEIHEVYRNPEISKPRLTAWSLLAGFIAGFISEMRDAAYTDKEAFEEKEKEKKIYESLMRTVLKKVELAELDENVKYLSDASKVWRSVIQEIKAIGDKAKRSEINGIRWVSTLCEMGIKELTQKAEEIEKLALNIGEETEESRAARNALELLNEEEEKESKKKKPKVKKPASTTKTVSEAVDSSSSSQQNNPQIFASLPSTLSNTTSVNGGSRGGGEMSYFRRPISSIPYRGEKLPIPEIQRTFIHYNIPPDVAVPGRAKSEPPPIL